MHHQNICIVGASAAGHSLANALIPTLPKTHRILLIEERDFSFFPNAALRAAVCPGWEKRMIVPLRQDVIFPGGVHHKLIAPNRVVELRRGSLVLEREFEGSREVGFFKCILATGSSQPSPMRPVPGSDIHFARATFTRLQEDIARARSVLIIGAGPVGIEVAGEIRHAHPAHAITLVHNLPHVMNTFNTASDFNASGNPHAWVAPACNPKLAIALEKLIAESHIDLITSDKALLPHDLHGNDEEADGRGGAYRDPSEWDGSFGLQKGMKKVRLASGKTVLADFVFVGIGNRSNVELVEKADEGALVDGQVWVDDYLRVQSNNPLSPLTQNYYAIGDASSTRGWKTIQGAQYDAAGCAVNIVREIKGANLEPYTRPVAHGMFVPLGPNKIAGYATIPKVGDVMLPVWSLKKMKSEKLTVPEYFWQRFKGKEKINEKTLGVAGKWN